jgi:fucose 4-O-acetylase-like acetyltransferase
MALWIGETGVPTYFFISGMLLFYSKKKYRQKLSNRVKTLLIPYLFFNSVILIGYFLLLLFGKHVVILEKNLTDYNLIDYLRAFWDRGSWSNGNSAPLLCPFWYIRNLMVLVVISPVLYYVLKYTKILFPIIMGILWINSYDSAYTLQSLTMFSLGAYFPISDKNPIVVFDKYKQIFLFTFVFLGVVDIAHTFLSIPFFLQIHRLSLIINVLFLVWIGDHLSRWHLFSPFLSKSSFFVFCIHYPIVLGLRNVFSRFTNGPDIILFIIYICSVIIICAICVFAYYLMRRTLPGLLNVITGSRD